MSNVPRACPEPVLANDGFFSLLNMDGTTTKRRFRTRESREGDRLAAEPVHAVPKPGAERALSHLLRIA
jgi:hypothetical protein